MGGFFQAQMRDSLLEMSLDKGLLPFIIRCVQEWSMGGLYTVSWLTNKNMWIFHPSKKISCIGIN